MSKYVRRSVYQKVCEENKRMRRDIEIMIGSPCQEWVNIRDKWRQLFIEKNKFNAMMKDAARRYFDNDKTELK